MISSPWIHPWNEMSEDKKTVSTVCGMWLHEPTIKIVGYWGDFNPDPLWLPLGRGRTETSRMVPSPVEERVRVRSNPCEICSFFAFHRVKSQMNFVQPATAG